MKEELNTFATDVFRRLDELKISIPIPIPEPSPNLIVEALKANTEALKALSEPLQQPKMSSKPQLKQSKARPLQSPL